MHALVTALYGLACPVVVAVDGAVSGLGCALLLAADARFGTQRAAVSAGDGPAAALLAGAGRVASAGAAAIDRLCWTADTLTAEPAVTAGVLTTLGSFEDARACAARLAADPAGWSAVKRAHRSRTRPDSSVRAPLRVVAARYRAPRLMPTDRPDRRASKRLAALGRASPRPSVRPSSVR